MPLGDPKPRPIKYFSIDVIKTFSEGELEQEIVRVAGYIGRMTTFMNDNYPTDLRFVPTDQALEFAEQERAQLEQEIREAETYLEEVRKIKEG